MALNEEQKLQIKVYYYFLLCDGQLSDDEMEHLSYICEELGVSEEDMNKQISYLENQISYKGNQQHYTDERRSINPERLFEVIKNLLRRTEVYLLPRKQLEIVWNLLGLAYADKTMSATEKSYISVVSKEWGIKDSIVNELADIANTIYMLKAKQSWVESADMPEDEKSRFKSEIDSDIEGMINDAYRTIEENCNCKRKTFYILKS